MSDILDQLQIREIFHLEFLRRLGNKLDPKLFAVKGGANLRFFFRSARYSEDLDIDAAGPDVQHLKALVFGILRSPSLADQLNPFGIREIRPPDPALAKQTETTQRFKIHLLTAAGENLFTKVEFSRRGLKGNVRVDVIPGAFLRVYRIPPLWIPHYDLSSAIAQKVEALASRATIQARDIFDLHVLAAPAGRESPQRVLADETFLRKARERIREVDFNQFRDTVLAYLSLDDRAAYDRADIWDDIRLRVAEFLGGNA